MLRKEYRIILPITVEEYQIAHLWTVMEWSKNNTGGGEGIEVVINEPYEESGEKGQYTHKVYHLQSKVPRFIRMLAPKGSLELHEKAKNSYPHCNTEISNPDYMKDKFAIVVDSLYLSDFGERENVHNLPEEDWRNTEVVRIDIVNDPISNNDYNQEFDPSLFVSKKTGRGPFGPNWIEKMKVEKQQGNPVAYMCAYKLVTCNFQWFGLKDKVEKLIYIAARRFFTLLNRQVVCSMDSWYGMTMDKIRELEDKTKKELDEMRQNGSVRGLEIPN